MYSRDPFSVNARMRVSIHLNFSCNNNNNNNFIVAGSTEALPLRIRWLTEISFLSNGMRVLWLNWTTISLVSSTRESSGGGLPRISRLSLLVYCSGSLRDFCTNFRSFAELHIWALRLTCSSLSALLSSWRVLKVSSICSVFVFNDFTVANASFSCPESGLVFRLKPFQAFPWWY